MSEIFSKLFDVEPRAWITVAIIAILSIIGLVYLSRSKSNPSSSTLRTKKLVYGGICISIAFILSYIKLFQLPQGGSITPASMFPLVLYSMIFGPVAGIVAGASYGLLQLIQDMWVINIAQLLLDYPLAFACIGLSGFAPAAIKNIYIRTSIAIVIGFFGRGFMHIVSGTLFFAEYAPEGMNPFIYSLTYNGSMILGELIIALTIAMILVGTPVYGTLKKLATPSF